MAIASRLLKSGNPFLSIHLAISVSLFKSFFSLSTPFIILTFNVLFTKSIIVGILSLLSLLIALIQRPSCCKNSILESSFKALNQIIPSILLT